MRHLLQKISTLQFLVSWCHSDLSLGRGLNFHLKKIQGEGVVKPSP